MEQKLAEDKEFFQEAVGGYEFASFYGGNLEGEDIESALQEDVMASVRTVVTEYDGEGTVIGFLAEYITEQNSFIDGMAYTYHSDFLARCVETAIGYLNISCDMGRVAYPEDEEDSWEKLFRRLNRMLEAYGEMTDGFDGTTVSEGDLRIRHFLALAYEDRRIGDKVYLEVDGTWGTTYFILRTHNEAIKDVEGGNWKILEDGAYLIEVQEKSVTITLEPADERYYR